MKIKITPQWEHRGPGEELEFRRLVQHISKLHYTTLLLHFSDGSVLMRSLTAEEIKMLTNKTEES